MGQLKGQSTRHACMSGQNASSACAVVLYFANLAVVPFFIKT